MECPALGGARQERSRSVRDLVAGAQVASIVIGDLNLDATNWFKQEPGSDKMPEVQVNATANASLIKVSENVHVVISLVGFYYRFGLPILRAAIQVDCHDVDICDDAEPTVEMPELHDRAKEAGIVSVIGCGVSVGTLNMLACDAANHFDKVDDLHFCWDVPSNDAEGDISKSTAYISRMATGRSGRHVGQCAGIGTRCVCTRGLSGRRYFSGRVGQARGRDQAQRTRRPKIGVRCRLTSRCCWSRFMETSEKADGNAH